MRLVNVIKTFSLLAFFSFLSAVWSEPYRNNFVWTGILFGIAAFVCILNYDEKVEKEKEANRNKKIDEKNLI